MILLKKILVNNLKLFKVQSFHHFSRRATDDRHLYIPSPIVYYLFDNSAIEELNFRSEEGEISQTDIGSSIPLFVFPTFIQKIIISCRKPKEYFDHNHVENASDTLCSH
jgi:hypothetical protein